LNLIKGKYTGSEEERFGPTLAAEHLAEEDGMVLDHDTLRLWMLQDGLWSRQRRRKKHCQRRERKPHFGELVQLHGSFQVPATQFGRTCQKLGIKIIAASSPQAKGRVERTHGVHQDRLIKKLRRKKIASYQAANQYLGDPARRPLSTTEPWPETLWADAKQSSGL
jgi:hypothetical protein